MKKLSRYTPLQHLKIVVEDCFQRIMEKMSSYETSCSHSPSPKETVPVFMEQERQKIFIQVQKAFWRWYQTKSLDTIEVLIPFCYLYEILDDWETIDWIIQYYCWFCILPQLIWKDKVLPLLSSMQSLDTYQDSFLNCITVDGDAFYTEGFRIISDRDLMMNIWTMKCYDPIDHYSPKHGDVVFDIGAGKGESVLWFYNKVKSKGQIYAFEMQERLLDIMKANIQTNQINNVHIISKGVWDKETCVSLDSTGAIDKSLQRGKANTLSLDAFIQTHQIDRLDFIKMDIEGAERQAIRGGEKTIRRFHPRMAIASYHHMDDPVALIADIKHIDASYHFSLSMKDSQNFHLILFAY